jgi:hypothetical protein
MSAKDIYAGARWSHELAKQISKSNFGILCVTRESMNKPWIMFEAGGLAKSLDEGCVIPLLVDLEGEGGARVRSGRWKVGGPRLSDFNIPDLTPTSDSTPPRDLPV